MYAWCHHQRPEGKRGAHKLKRLAYREEIATIVEENRLETINSVEDLVLVLVKAGYRVQKKSKDFTYRFENDTIFGLFGGEGDYPMSPYTENKICANVTKEFDRWGTADLLDLEFLGKDAEEILLVLRDVEYNHWIDK